MPAHAARAALSFSGKHTKSGNLSVAVNSFARGLSFNFIQGIGAGQVDLIHHDELTFYEGQKHTIDLQSFTDMFNVAGNSFATIRLLAAKFVCDSSTVRMNIRGTDVDYKLPWQPTQGGIYQLQPDASMMRVSWETGWAVEADNAKVSFQMTEIVGGDTGTVEFLIAGVAA